MRPRGHAWGTRRGVGSRELCGGWSHRCYVMLCYAREKRRERRGDTPHAQASRCRQHPGPEPEVPALPLRVTPERRSAARYSRRRGQPTRVPDDGNAGPQRIRIALEPPPGRRAALCRAALCRAPSRAHLLQARRPDGSARQQHASLRALRGQTHARGRGQRMRGAKCRGALTRREQEHDKEIAFRSVPSTESVLREWQYSVRHRGSVPA